VSAGASGPSVPRHHPHRARDSPVPKIPCDTPLSYSAAKLGSPPLGSAMRPGLCPQWGCGRAAHIRTGARRTRGTSIWCRARRGVDPGSRVPRGAAAADARVRAFQWRRASWHLRHRAFASRCPVGWLAQVRVPRDRPAAGGAVSAARHRVPLSSRRCNNECTDATNDAPCHRPKRCNHVPRSRRSRARGVLRRCPLATAPPLQCLDTAAFLFLDSAVSG
jgi:hypothetical protein